MHDDGLQVVVVASGGQWWQIGNGHDDGQGYSDGSAARNLFFLARQRRRGNKK